MNISESFAELIHRIQPPQSEIDAALQHRDTIKTRLEAEFELYSCRQIGSSARGSSIRGFSDTDLLAAFPKKSFTRGGNLINSDTALDNVRNALMERFPNSNIGKDGIAIVVAFSDGRYVDVVPGVFEGMYEKWPVFSIPDGAGGWMRTSPALYDAYIQQANQQSGYKLIQVAQLMKFWRECREPRVPFSSFHIEMILAGEAVCKGVKSYPECMLDILRNLAAREGRAMRDPYDIAGNIPALKTWSQRERAQSSIVNSRDHAQWARQAEVRGDLQEARRQWDIVFNGQFPW